MWLEKPCSSPHKHRYAFKAVLSVHSAKTEHAPHSSSSLLSSSKLTLKAEHCCCWWLCQVHWAQIQPDFGMSHSCAYKQHWSQAIRQPRSIAITAARGLTIIKPGLSNRSANCQPSTGGRLHHLLPSASAEGETAAPWGCSSLESRAVPAPHQTSFTTFIALVGSKSSFPARFSSS